MLAGSTTGKLLQVEVDGSITHFETGLGEVTSVVAFDGEVYCAGHQGVYWRKGDAFVSVGLPRVMIGPIELRAVGGRLWAVAAHAVAFTTNGQHWELMAFRG